MTLTREQIEEGQRRYKEWLSEQSRYNEINLGNWLLGNAVDLMAMALRASEPGREARAEIAEHLGAISAALYAINQPSGMRSRRELHICGWQFTVHAQGGEIDATEKLHNLLTKARSALDALHKLEPGREARDAVLEEAAREYENVNPASDDERLKGHPGAGAMGAVIEFRDRIRALKSSRGSDTPSPASSAKPGAASPS